MRTQVKFFGSIKSNNLSVGLNISSDSNNGKTNIFVKLRTDILFVEVWTKLRSFVLLICTFKMENINSVIHWKLFCYETKCMDFDCMIHQHKKKTKYPSSLHFYYGGCPCRRKDSPLSQNENVTKALPTCTFFYFFIGIKNREYFCINVQRPFEPV